MANSIPPTGDGNAQQEPLKFKEKVQKQLPLPKPLPQGNGTVKGKWIFEKVYLPPLGAEAYVS